MIKKLTIGCFLLMAAVATGNAHTEGNLFAIHPPKTAVGLLTKETWLEVHGQQGAIAVAPFLEYSPSPYFSIGVGAPSGFFRGSYYFSDLVAAAKTQLPLQHWTVVPSVSAELPTGRRPATSGHTELVATVFIEKKPPDWHIYSYPGVRWTFSEKEEPSHSHQGSAESIPGGNVFNPHTEKELYLAGGATYWASEKWGFDVRGTGYYENFEQLTARLQGGIIYSATVWNRGLKTSLEGTYTTGGVRQGPGVALSVYYSL